MLPNSQGVVQNTLVKTRSPEDLVKELALNLPKGEGRGEEGLLQTIRDVLKYSVNTWDQGFLDKLYASTNPVGVTRSDRSVASGDVARANRVMLRLAWLLNFSWVC